MLTLYQAEWCPYSSAVRERLTELSLDFVARQVAPYPQPREGELEIPTLETEDGERYTGTREIFAYLRRYDENEHTAEHRARYVEHRPARLRDAPGVILERATPAGRAA